MRSAVVKNGFEIRGKDIRKSLLAWYDLHARDLPWRMRPGEKKKADPYRVWVSEIMLQQTRVAAVMEHYREFLRRFPNVMKLAGARESAVLAAWSGLGYYRRARMMHAAAKLLAREHGGRFPRTAAEWQELPGVGRYTAAAIASIAFGEATAVVDGNVERVLERLSGRRLHNAEVWASADGLLDRERPGDFNQAMMELGATVCTPRAPACLTCPVVSCCATRGELEPEAKSKSQRKKEIHYGLHVRSINSHSEVFLVQRPPGARLMAGMWELPEIERLKDRAGADFTLRHSITVTDYRVGVWQTGLQEGISGKWFSLEKGSQIALTGLSRKILRKAALLG